MQIRPATPADLDSLIALNDAEIPHVTRLVVSLARRFLHEAAVFAVAEEGDDELGFVVALSPGLDYESPNYRWVGSRYEEFLYVDRIVVAADRSGEGIGRRLYAHIVAEAKNVPILCEVNLRPPNPGSLAFHHRLGFAEVGRLASEGGTKEVSLLRLDPERLR